MATVGYEHSGLGVRRTVKPLRFARFLTIGGLTVPLGLVCLWFCVDGLGMSYLVGHGIALAVTSAVWLIGQAWWTFQDREKGPGRLLGALLVRLLSSGAYTACLVGLVEILGVWYLAAAVLSLGASAVFSYLACDKLVLKPPEE